VQALAREMHTLYAMGRQTVADELNRQRGNIAEHHMAAVTLRAQSFAAEPPDDSIAQRALLAAQAIMARIATAIGRLHVSGPRSQAELQRAGEQEAGAALRAEAQLNAAPALNLGRDQQAQQNADQIAGSYYTSILDGNRCEPCSAADDDVLRPLTDPVAMAEGATLDRLRFFTDVPDLSGSSSPRRRPTTARTSRSRLPTSRVQVAKTGTFKHPRYGKFTITPQTFDR
jgi:hypothetical protein